MNYCLDCGAELEGRADKKFCSDHCKSSYHYERSKSKATSLFKTIDAQLKKNRRLLKLYNRAGKATVRKEVLIEKGFNPRYFTHYWKAGNGNVYLFCRVPTTMNMDTWKKLKTTEQSIYWCNGSLI